VGATKSAFTAGSTRRPHVTAEEEERLLDKAIEYLTKVTGKRPPGYRAPSWAFSSVTLDLIQKKGFLYDSSLQALVEPYEIESRGKLTGIVELPIDWTLTETPFLGQNGRMPNPAFLYQIHKDKFDGAYKSKPGVWFATAADIAQHVKANKP
jgi:peptidoglycan-N-acetylglucosamine deacetylase